VVSCYHVALLLQEVIWGLEFGVWSLEPIGPGFVGLYLSSLTAVPWLSRNRQKRGVSRHPQSSRSAGGGAVARGNINSRAAAERKGAKSKGGALSYIIIEKECGQRGCLHRVGC
jgi:hypothetical protein